MLNRIFINLFRYTLLLATLHLAASASVRLPEHTDSTQTVLSHGEYTDDTTRLLPSPTRLALIGALTTGGFIYGHLILSDIWWKGESTAFHFDWERDWTYALGGDKLGHYYFPYVATDLYRQAFLWSRLDSTASLYIAGGIAFSYQTYIEIRDGFSEEWGFSWGDFAANSLGVAYRIAEHHVPDLEKLRFKISFYPSAPFREGAYNAIIDDYESTYHWASLDVHSLLPESWQDYYPSFINIALGHSVKGLIPPDSPTHEIFLSLDWNLERLPGDGPFWNFLKRTLNYYHLPAPAIRIAPDLIWYGLKF